MLKLRRHHKEIGTAPGTLIPPKNKKLAGTTIEAIRYNEYEIEEKRVEKIEECFPLKEKGYVLWININGLQDIDLVRTIGEHYNLHMLALEDLLNLGQRPKVEVYDEHLFAVFKMVKKDLAEHAEQVSMFVADGLLITFQEIEGDVFEPVRKRLRAGKNRMRKSGADYLAYALLDQAVDELYPVLEHYSDRIEELEERMMQRAGREDLEEAHKLKRELLALKRIAWPERDLINSLLRDESGIIQFETKLYLRDVYDHTIQIVDLTSTYRDMAMDLVDLYMSSASNHMNEVMKVLTMIATIFIPMTFISSIYGMNFNTEVSDVNMPELNWVWGYPAALGVMLLMALLMLFYFKRKTWL